MMRNILLYLFVFLIENQLINSDLINECLYEIETFDNKTIECFGDQCSTYLDIKSMKRQLETCQTSFLSLSFSTYKHFVLFRDQSQNRLSHFFSRSTSKQNRYFYLYLNQLDVDDKPFHQSELALLGTNIDFYFLFIRNLSNEYQQYIHHHSNDPQWNIIKIHIRCRQWKGFDQYPCSPYLIRPSIFPFEKVIKNLIQIQNSTFSSTIINIHYDNQSKSNQLISIIIISSIFLFIILFIFLIVYLCMRRKCNESSSMRTSSNDDNTSQKCSTISHGNDLYCHDDDRINSETLSVLGQQYFVPVSSSINF